ncbi:MAG: glutamate--tRNA ligase [Actinomycetota bacterium]|nr:glutamate--tRNA ligase [Actinomycetota bacterium]
MDTDDDRPLRVRFAPSPTGSLHVGGARTALFNWLAARHADGTFILRLEDTDRERSTPESEAEILRVMQWMGLDWDEGPFRQSERDDIYRECIEKLKAAGAVYAAWETAEELDAMRAEARANKQAPVVRGRRDHTPEEIAAFEAEGRTPVWRFAVPLPGETVIDDMIRGTVTFDHAQIEDFVVARSDGSPTYNLAAAVDDMLMGITRVIRGEDHISNTPKQMLVIRALGGEPPQYAHVPLILGTDKKRLSKRHGAASVEELEADGFLPQPVRNALVLLGWSYDDKTTTFTMDELIEKFDVSRVSKSPAVFDMKKLEVMSGRYLRTMDPGEFADALVGWLQATGYFDDKGADAPDIARRTAPMVQRKLSRLSEYDRLAGWLYRPLEFEPEALSTLEDDVKTSIQCIGGGLGRIEVLDEFTSDAIKDALSDQLHIQGVSAREFLEPQRIAITGQTVSTGIYESLELLGRDESVARYRATLGRLAEAWQGGDA